MRIFLVLALLLFWQPSTVYSLLPGLYCGTENCYDVLGVSRDSSKSEIARAYRKLAGQYHPDRVKGAKAKQESEEKFRVVAVAYETLKDEDARKDYDYMLDNPDELYRHYWYYYKRKAPKVDPSLVIIATVLLISAIQYISAWQKYNEAVAYLVTVPKYRTNAKMIAEERGLLNSNIKTKRKDRPSKEEKKQEEEAILRSIILEKMDIQGGYRRPNPLDILVAQIILSPYTLSMYLKWYFTWIWRFNINKEPYGEEEKLYIIRRYLKMSAVQFDAAHDEKAKSDLLARELWIKDNFDVWYAAKLEAEKEKLAESAAAKRYRRYMKTHGPGQISFLDDD